MNPLRFPRRPFLLGAASLAALPALRAADAVDPGLGRRPSDRWADLREALFGGRPTERATDASGFALAVARRPADSAAVPVSVVLAAELASDLRAVWIVVDANPAPLALYAEAGPAADLRSLSTVLRVEAPGLVHAVVETGSGRLLETASFVEASHGVSAPPGRDAVRARGSIGRMRLDLPEGAPAPGRTVPVRLAVNHPNATGRQVDNASGATIPASFLRRLAVRYRGIDLLRIEADTAISQDPTFGFGLAGEPGGELRAEAEDSDGRRFRSVWTLGATG